MKKLLPFLLVLIPLVASAQQGTITYDHAVKYEFEIPEAWKEYRDKIPTQSTASMVLLFDGIESLMKEAPAPAKEKDAAATDRMSDRARGMAARLKMGSTSRSDQETFLVTYLNHDDGTFTETRKFMGRVFLISDEQPAYAWKLTGEESEFLGYMVQKATAMQDSTTIEAWFTPEISVSAGPGLYGGLPGMILAISVDEGRIVYSATEVNLDGLEDGMITPPEDGQEVSRDEYEKIVAEKLKEVKARRRGRRSDRR